MRFYIFITIFLLNSFLAFSQSFDDSYSLKWYYDHISFDSSSQPIKAISFENAIYDEENHYLPVFYKVIPVENISDFEVKLINTEFEIIENPQTFYPKEIKIESKISYSSKSPNLSISFIPIRFNEDINKFEKLVSFDLIVNSVEAITAKRPIQKRMGASSSVLANGDWYKMSITESGVFKIDYELLKNIGIDPSKINPKNIRIYGNGGGMLPQPNSEFRPDDLNENSIFVSGEDDGSFDRGDYILFYAQGPHVWEYNNSNGYFKHHLNHYSDKSYYFITASLGAGKRIKNTPSLNNSADYETSVCNCFDYHEITKRTDVTDYVKSGRDWYGETFDFTTNYDFDFNLPNLKTDDSVSLKSYVAARSEYGSVLNYFRIETNGQSFIQGIDKVDPDYNDTYCKINSSRFKFLSNSENISISYTYSKPNSLSAGWLNYIELNGICNLKFSGAPIIIRDASSIGKGITQFEIASSVSDLKIWDITSSNDVMSQEYLVLGNKIIFKTKTGSLKEFVIFGNSGFKTPGIVGKVENQNLHSIEQVDMIIVSHPDFINAAQELSKFHKEKSGLSVEIVTPNQIYNEFSSGAQDITAIRDFIKMLYDKAPNGEEPQYLLLFGDASYDYKNTLDGNTNYVPTYQSVDIRDPLSSYASDDYYGFLDNNEGDFDNSSASSSDILDIAIGRLPVHSKSQANEMVAKIKNYYESQTFGDWRNKVVFVSDDVDDDGFNDHIRQSEELTGVIRKEYKDLNVTKVYMDAFKQVSTPNGYKYPDVTKTINDKMNSGVLVMNYIGHGGEAGWAHERILEVPDIKSWENFNTLPLFVTATCEFSRYDDPGRISAGEWVLLNPNGGSIAMLTTCRVVYVSGNNTLTNNLYNNNIFEGYKSFGEIITDTKNRSKSSINTRKFVLLGDPALKLAYPRYQVVTDEIPDTLKALSLVEIKGHIEDGNGNKMSNFNGEIFPSIFDKETVKVTLVNDNNSKPINFKVQENIIYKGKASVENGDFTFSFIVPKDISYNNGNGKISYYATDYKVDANGYYDQFIVGGTSDNYIEDNTPPIVRLFIGDSNFISGGITDANPLLYALLYDENGINTTGNGIGHELVATLDNSQYFILNDYYESTLNSYKSGMVKYPLSGLDEGKHTLSIKVWDIANNSASDEIEFFVVSSSQVKIENLFNYPNPVSDHTIFSFEHNQSGESFEAIIDIYNLSGGLVRELKETFYPESNRVNGIEWDLKDNSGNTLGSGIYIFRLLIKLEDGRIATDSSKLVILD